MVLERGKDAGNGESSEMQAENHGLLGSCIAGKYLVANVVEETDLSVIYQADHLVWQRPVAIKTIKAAHLDAAARSDLLASFVREGALLAELSERSTAICQAHDIGAVTMPDGTWIPYMVLEWLEGETLETICTREQAAEVLPRSVAEVVSLLAPMAEALSLAHARGVVHCDVKPANVILRRDAVDHGSRCKLLDFGIARVARGVASATAGGLERAYTPGYAAPEQFEPTLGPTGPWTDVFALALVAVELLCGCQALQGDSIAILAAQARDPERRPTPRALGAHVADEVEAVFERALEVDPLKRYADAGIFWKALEHAVAAHASGPDNLPIPLRHRRFATPLPCRKVVTSKASHPTRVVRWQTVAFWIIATACALLPGLAH
jgi:serine/threonine protein kinase